MKQYTRLIFDADHTLLDYAKDELAAFARVFEKLGVNADLGMLERAHALSEFTWTEAGLYDVEREFVQREYHNLYRAHVTPLFERIFNEFGVSGDAKAGGRLFLKELEEKGRPLANAYAVLKTLKNKYRIAIATNGLSAIQRGRMKAFEGLFDTLIISEDVGAIKPTAAFWGGAFEKIKEDKGECLMVGDSLRSDVAGAKRAGLDACWFNPLKKPFDGEVQPDFSVCRLDELLQIL